MVTTLHAAAATGQAAIIEYLIAAGADVNAVNRSGDSPLEIAASQGHQEAAKILVDHRAMRVRGSDEQRSKAACEIAREMIERMHPSIGAGRSC